MIELILVFFLVFVALPVGVAFVLYWIPKKLGYPKVGKILAGLFALCIAALLFTAVFEDELFTKADAKKLLAKQGIILNDKFTLEHNESQWDWQDFYQKFTLKISDSDRQRLINDIRRSKTFRGCDNSEATRYMGSDYGYDIPAKTLKYETDDSYVTETFPSNHASTFGRISVSKEDNTLTYEYTIE